MQSRHGINKEGKNLKEVIMGNNHIFGYFEFFKPNSYKIFKHPIGSATGNEHMVPEVFFTDSNGISWYRHSNGILEKFNYIPFLESGYIGKHV
ncbi:hypothetical protein ACLN1Y_00200 [Apilactobacillus kunkeei]|uniref:hypothetical protein n=1 Tax=Apilactobacillus kunkeei TaxID=148814 RepID=UPI0039E09348